MVGQGLRKIGVSGWVVVDHDAAGRRIDIHAANTGHWRKGLLKPFQEAVVPPGVGHLDANSSLNIRAFRAFGAAGIVLSAVMGLPRSPVHECFLRIIECTRGAVQILSRMKLKDTTCECYGVIQQYGREVGLK